MKLTAEGKSEFNASQALAMKLRDYNDRGWLFKIKSQTTKWTNTPKGVKWIATVDVIVITEGRKV